MKKKIVPTLCLFVLLFLGVNANANIIGSIGFQGIDIGVSGGSTLLTATGFTFKGTDDAYVTSVSGVLSGVPYFAPPSNVSPADLTYVDYHNFSFTAASGELWNFTSGGTTYEFDMTGITSVAQSIIHGSDACQVLGTGTLYVTSGGTTTPYKDSWSISANQSGTSVTWSATSTIESSPAPIPEPATLLLLGAGMTVLGVFRGRMKKA